MKKFTCALLAIIIVISFTGCNTTTASTDLFDEYTKQEFIDSVSTDSISLNYQLKNPEAYGIKNFKPTFGEFNIEDIEKDEKDIDAAISKLKTFKYAQLSDSQKLTYDIMMESLKTDKMSKGLTFYSEIFSPLYGFQSQLTSILPEYPIDVVKDLDDYLDLLKDTPRYFDQLITFEKEKSKQGLFMADKTVDKVIVQCRNIVLAGEDNPLITLFPDMIKSLELNEADKNSYIAKNKEMVMDYIIPTYKKLADELTQLKGTGKNQGGLSNFDKGKEWYEYLFKHKTGSSKSISEVIKLLDDTIVAEITLVLNIATKNPNIYDDYSNFKFGATKPKEILEILETRIVNDYPALEKVDYAVKSVHKSLEGNSSPAFYIIPPIDAPEQNVIYTNDSSLNSESRLFSTLAHEGYPGHLYQHNYFLSTNPQPIRSAMNFLGYSEGWATYAENHSYELANMNNDALVQFMQVDNTLSTTLMARMDIGINYESWTIDQVKAYLGQFYGEGAEEMATNSFDLMVEEPGNPLPYCIGYLEIIELQNIASESLGEKFVLKDFNKAILDVGPAPFSIVKAEVEKWMATVK